MKTTNEPVQLFKKHLVSSGRELSTVDSYASDIRLFRKFLETKKVKLKKANLSLLEEFTQKLSLEKQESKNSIRRKIISIRQFYKFLYETGEIEENSFTASLIPDRQEQLPELLKEKELSLILKRVEEQESHTKSTRDRALITLLAKEGIKAAELIELKWFDFLKTKESSSLKIRGPRARTIFLEKDSSFCLNEYRKALENQKEDTLKVERSGRIFVAFKGKEQNTPSDKITRHGIKFLLYEIGEKSGVPKLNTELLRHYAIQFLLEKKGSLQSVKDHLGLKQAGNILKHIKKSK